MRRLILAALGVLLAAATAWGQSPLHEHGATTSTQFRSIITDPTGTGALVFGTRPEIKGIVEAYATATITSNVLTIDLSTGTSVFNVTNNANITTFTITGATVGKVNSFMIFITGNGSAFTQTWGASVKWANATAPTLTATSGKTDALTFVTNDGGGTWFGFVGGQNF